MGKKIMDTREIVALPLARRLEVMEALCDSLSGDDAVSPTWHEPILIDRARALDEGRETTSSWSKAKARIRKAAGTS